MLTTPARVQPAAKGRSQGQTTTRSPIPKHYRNSIVGFWGQAGKAEAPVPRPAQGAVTGPGEGPAARAARQNGRPGPRAAPAPLLPAPETCARLTPVKNPPSPRGSHAPLAPSALRAAGPGSPFPAGRAGGNKEAAVPAGDAASREPRPHLLPLGLVLLGFGPLLPGLQRQH